MRMVMGFNREVLEWYLMLMMMMMRRMMMMVMMGNGDGVSFVCLCVFDISLLWFVAFVKLL